MMKIYQERFKNHNFSREMNENGDSYFNECDLSCLQKLSIKNLVDSLIVYTS